MHYYGPDAKRRCFDAMELLQHFESSLTSSKYGNPFPQYPTDPFSREPFTLNQLEEFLSFCQDSGIDVNSVAPTFARFVQWTRSVPDRDAIDARPFAPNILQTVVDSVVRGSQQGGGLTSLFKMLGLA